LLVLWSDNELSRVEENIHQNDLEAVCYDKSAYICLLKSRAVESEVPSSDSDSCNFDYPNPTPTLTPTPDRLRPSVVLVT